MSSELATTVERECENVGLEREMVYLMFGDYDSKENVDILDIKHMGINDTYGNRVQREYIQTLFSGENKNKFIGILHTHPDRCCEIRYQSLPLWTKLLLPSGVARRCHKDQMHWREKMIAHIEKNYQLLRRQKLLSIDEASPTWLNCFSIPELIDWHNRFFELFFDLYYPLSSNGLSIEPPDIINAVYCKPERKFRGATIFDREIEIRLKP